MMGDYEKKSRQLCNLESLVENHRRTQRHLEQYSERGNAKKIARKTTAQRRTNKIFGRS
jgi:hypothetical protein